MNEKIPNFNESNLTEKEVISALRDSGLAETAEFGIDEPSGIAALDAWRVQELVKLKAMVEAGEISGTERRFLFKSRLGEIFALAGFQRQTTRCLLDMQTILTEDDLLARKKVHQDMVENLRSLI